MESASLTHLLDDTDYTKILALNAKFAGLMDISGTNLFHSAGRLQPRSTCRLTNSTG